MNPRWLGPWQSYTYISCTDRNNKGKGEREGREDVENEDEKKIRMKSGILEIWWRKTSPPLPREESWKYKRGRNRADKRFIQSQSRYIRTVLEDETIANNTRVSYFVRDSSIPCGSIDACININLGNEREGRKEARVGEEGSKIKQVRSVCSTRIPAARQSFRELSPTPPRGIELRIRSSPTNSTLHVSRKILLEIPRRGKFFSNLSPFHPYYLAETDSTRRVSFRWPTILRQSLIDPRRWKINPPLDP